MRAKEGPTSEVVRIASRRSFFQNAAGGLVILAAARGLARRLNLSRGSWTRPSTLFGRASQTRPPTLFGRASQTRPPPVRSGMTQRHEAVGLRRGSTVELFTFGRSRGCEVIETD